MINLIKIELITYYNKLYIIMTTIYVFKLNEDKYYISELGDSIINFYNKEWIKKYPIQTIIETKENTNIEKVYIYYIKEYGIDNVRSDLYSDVELSDAIKIRINSILNDSLESVSNRIKSINGEITDLKSVFDIIEKNNIVINEYKNYRLFEKVYNLHELFLNQLLKQQPELQHQKLRLYQEKNILSCQTYNLLLPDFINSFIKDKLKQNYNLIDIIKPILEDHFSDHKLVEKIANALLLQKKNEKLISKYGTIEEINKKLSNMLYKKIELIHMLDNESDDIEE